MVRSKKILISVLFVLMMILSGCEKKEMIVEDKQGTSESVEIEDVASEEASINIPEVQFPILLEEGQLEIGSLFPFEGFNPDAGNEVGSDIASISVRNLTNQYLEEANITVVVNEETEISFIVTDLPAGASAMAFSVENISLEKNAVCSSVSGETVFSNEIVGIPEGISVQEDDIQVNVTNVSGQDMSKVTIYCRCPLDEEYFGGIAYQYELQGLAAVETKVVDTEELLLGMVEVVRVEIE